MTNKKHINPISVCDGLSIHFAKLGDYNHITINTGVLGGQELDVFEDEVPHPIQALQQVQKMKESGE